MNRLAIARELYFLREQATSVAVQDILWNEMWDMLVKYFEGNYNRIEYVLDLFLHILLKEKYDDNYLKRVLKNHCRRGLDQYHW